MPANQRDALPDHRALVLGDEEDGGRTALKVLQLTLGQAEAAGAEAHPLQRDGGGEIVAPRRAHLEGAGAGAATDGDSAGATKPTVAGCLRTTCLRSIFTGR